MSRDFLLHVFFHESPSPQSLEIALGSFWIFSQIRGDIRKSRCNTGINDTSGKFAKKNSKWHCWYTQWVGGKWFTKKTRSRKSRGTVPSRNNGKFPEQNSGFSPSEGLSSYFYPLKFRFFLFFSPDFTVRQSLTWLLTRETRGLQGFNWGLHAWSRHYISGS